MFGSQQFKFLRGPEVITRIAFSLSLSLSSRTFPPRVPRLHTFLYFSHSSTLALRLLSFTLSLPLFLFLSFNSGFFSVTRLFLSSLFMRCMLSWNCSRAYSHGVPCTPCKPCTPQTFFPDAKSAVLPSFSLSLSAFSMVLYTPLSPSPFLARVFARRE